MNKGINIHTTPKEKDCPQAKILFVVSYEKEVQNRLVLT
jgi:hypothetical protein